ncbi:MAG: aldehyde dehydrogenase (NADP(+)) [Granulosicoccus sp.]
MTFKPHGKHLIAGNWIDGSKRFESSPAVGEPDYFSIGTVEHVDSAVTAAEEAFWSYGYSSRTDRATLLSCIADEIETKADTITEIGTRETGLPEVRLMGELGRTTAQLRLFAEHITVGNYLDKTHQEALPDRAPMPGPDLKLIQRPIGPVAVFGASNFPLAFSTAGGDTAAALAAGCPVVMKAHSAHPGTCEIVAAAIATAISNTRTHPGAFSLIQGGSRDVGAALVQHPEISAVGFTGSLAGGRALFDLCAARENPIPFFGELGSVNPMFLLPSALQERGADIGSGWADSLTMGAGQFCTNPGIAVGLVGQLDEFTNAAKSVLSRQRAQVMLTHEISRAYAEGLTDVLSLSGVEQLVKGGSSDRSATPVLAKTTGDNWLKQRQLCEEVFGPFGLIVEVESMGEMHAVAKALNGQLTCTLHMNDADTGHAQSLVPILERKAGRILVNGFPTGVEVSDAMVHGGPYPASTNFGATSVGTMSIRRFLRPVCYQNMADVLVNDWDS